MSNERLGHAAAKLALIATCSVSVLACSDDDQAGQRPQVLESATPLLGLHTHPRVDGRADRTERFGTRLRRQVQYRALAARIAAEIHESGVPGGALAIVENRSVAFATGFGAKAAGGEEPVSADTRFRIGSIAKTFTAAVATQLAAEQVLSLDAPITTYLPGFMLHPPYDPGSLTLRKLLSHTAGVPDYGLLQCDVGDEALGAWFDAHPDLGLWSPPGRLWNYSNLGYALAGRVIEQAAGVPFRQLLAQKLFVPLELDTATFDTEAVLAAHDYARGTLPDQSESEATFAECALLEPPGLLWSSATDVAKFALALLDHGGGVLDRSVFARMQRPEISTRAPDDAYYGLGLFSQDVAGLQVVFHAGDLPGYHAVLMMVPSRGLAVVVLVNGDTYAPIRGALQVLTQLLDIEPPPPRDDSTPVSDWWRYVGTYSEQIPADAFPAQQVGSVEVVLEDARLVARTSDGQEYALTQLSRDTWSAMLAGEVVPLTFWRGEDGAAEYIATRIGVVQRVGASAP